MKECTYCGEEIQDKAKKCRYCGEWIISNEIEVDKNNIENKIIFQEKFKETNISKIEKNKKGKEDSKKLEGLGGWLIFVGIGLIINPIVILLYFYLLYDINIGSDIIVKIIIDLLLNIVLFILSIISIYLFFIKDKIFPLLFKIMTILSILVIFYEFSFLNNIYGFEWKDILRNLIYSSIWLLYIEKSIRVKNTFVEYLYNKIIINTLIFISTLIILGLAFSVLISVNYLNKDNLGNSCIETFGENSIYTGEDEDGNYLCDCKEGYKFGGENDNECIIILENNSLKDASLKDTTKKETTVVTPKKDTTVQLPKAEVAASVSTIIQAGEVYRQDGTSVPLLLMNGSYVVELPNGGYYTLETGVTEDNRRHKYTMAANKPLPF